MVKLVAAFSGNLFKTGHYRAQAGPSGEIDRVT